MFEEERVFVPKKIQNWIDHGYSTYVDTKKLRGSPKEHKMTPEDTEWARKHLREELVPMGAAEKLTQQEVLALPAKAVINNVVVAEREGKRRFCWAGKRINEALDESHFRMEGWEQIAQLVEPGDVAFSLDFEKGYLQVPVKQGMKNFLLFRFDGEIYRFRVMPFGLGDAPKDFSAIVKRVVTIFRKRGFRCVCYIDDLIFFAKTVREAEKMRAIVLRILHRLNFRVSVKKSLVSAGELLRHLGFDLCTRDASLWVPEDKAAHLHALAHKMLQHCRQPQPARDVAKIVGKLQSWRYACPAVTPFTRGLSRTLDQLPLVPQAPSARTRRGKKQRQTVFEARDYRGTVQLDQLAIAELRFWLDVVYNVRGTWLKRPLEAIAFVDASRKGYGVVWTAVRTALRDRSKLRSRDLVVSDMRMGRWTRYCSERSTEFELANISDELTAHASTLAGKRVLVVTDNVGAAHIAGKGCQGNRRLHAASLRLWASCIRHDVAVSTQWLSGEGIITSGADGLSRGEDAYDCRLTRAAFEELWEAWGPFEVDCCATPDAVQRHPRTGERLEFVSPYGDGAIWADARTLKHAGRLYAFPPLPLIGELLAHVVAEGLRMVIVVPEWPMRPWWPVVAGQPSMRLGLTKDVVEAGTQGYAHPFGATFQAEEASRTPLRAVAFNM